jgi:hypothetical protein
MIRNENWEQQETTGASDLNFPTHIYRRHFVFLTDSPAAAAAHEIKWRQPLNWGNRLN